MRRGQLLWCITLACVAACGPEPPGESATDPGSSSTDGPTGSTDGPAPTTTGPTPDPSSADPTAAPTTGEPSTCPEGQPWDPLGSATLDAGGDFVASARRHILAVTADGRVAVAGAQDSLTVPAVLLASPTGEVLAKHAGEPGLEVEPLALQQGPEGDLVLLAARNGGDGIQPSLSRLAADGSLLSEVALELPVFGEAFGLAPDGAVVAGFDLVGGERVLAKFAIDSGALLWKHTLGGLDELLVDRVLVGSQGAIVLAMRRNGDDQGVSNRLDVELRDPDGAVLWGTAMADIPYDFTGALALTPNQQIVVMRNGPASSFVDLIALDLAGGPPVWFQTVAAADETGRPAARDLIVDADALTIPILRTGADDLSLGSVAIQRVGFDGELLETVPLPVPPNSNAHFKVLARRGHCGELVLLAGEAPELWLGSFAP